ncbi:MAG: bifunctional 5,10-methylenetetrahydrofolate dehydrogenase/5,10-methenyltetrahydrofolate cyclohydrolase [Patescibacteria group bacterium]
MMRFDGNAAAHEVAEGLKKRVANIKRPLRLAMISVGENSVTRSFMKKKEEFGLVIGVGTRIYSVPESASTTAMRKKIAEVVHIKQNTAVIIQLPLPAHMQPDYLVNAVPAAKDADVLSSRAIGDYTMGRGVIVPPVVGAIEYILAKAECDISGKNIVVLGAGRLVGRPVSLWLTKNQAVYTLIGKETPDMEERLKSADLVISGVGKPGLITAKMLKKGAVVIDAGTAESHGKVVGDVDPIGIENVASLYTPVPGGVGPLTVAMVFRNLVALAEQKK